MKAYDMSSSGLTRTLDRVEIIDFAKSLGSDRITLISVLEDEVESINLYAYINIINPQARIILTAVVLTLTLSYFVVMAVTLDGRAKFTLGDSFALVLLLIAQRDMNHVKSAVSVKIIFLVTVFFGYLTYSYYTAILTSVMATNPPKVRISSFQDVLERGLSITGWKGSAIEQFAISADKDSAMHQVYANSDGFSDSYEEQMRLLKEGVLIWGSVIEFSGETGVKFYDISEERKTLYGFVLQKDSEFTRLFDHHILRLKQTGVIKQIHDIWINQRKPAAKGEEKGEDFFTLGFSNLTLPFLDLAIGTLISFLLAVAEFLNTKYRAALKRYSSFSKK